MDTVSSNGHQVEEARARRHRDLRSIEVLFGELAHVEGAVTRREILLEACDRVAGVAQIEERALHLAASLHLVTDRTTLRRALQDLRRLRRRVNLLRATTPGDAAFVHRVQAVLGQLHRVWDESITRASQRRSAAPGAHARRRLRTSAMAPALERHGAAGIALSSMGVALELHPSSDPAT